MKMEDIHDLARQMLEGQGDKAEYTAEQNALKAAEAGNDEEAETWKKVRMAIREMRGSHVS